MYVWLFIYLKYLIWYLGGVRYIYAWRGQQYRGSRIYIYLKMLCMHVRIYFSQMKMHTECEVKCHHILQCDLNFTREFIFLNSERNLFFLDWSLRELVFSVWGSLFLPKEIDLWEFISLMCVWGQDYKNPLQASDEFIFPEQVARR